MKLRRKILLSGILLISLGAYFLFFFSWKQEEVDFSTEIKPLLNKHCITCHGGVKKNGKFSVLFRHEAMDTTESGKPAIIPGDADHSELIHRITSNDPEERMPSEGEPLSKEEIQLLKDWIDQGAKWGEHWAYKKPEKLSPPDVETLAASTSADQETSWIKNDIDKFILEKLNEESLQPSAEADRATLIRRVSFDLIGLPPSPEDVKAFESDNSPEAYEKVVDKLLASPHYGERWASMWMDLARYADTRGYEKDSYRNIWKYRDWLINAFNHDMPFDQFTIEQLAGDLLPNPSPELYVATAFHRNTMNNDEGGTDNEEFRVAEVIDRVNTTWEVWQGTTFSCIQCHSHPYDPFTHDEYYKFFAFFNNTRDEDTFTESPNYKEFSSEDEEKVDDIKNWITHHGSAKENKEKAEEIARFIHITEPKVHPHNFDSLTNGTHADTKFLVVYPGGFCRLKDFNLTGKTRLLISFGWALPNGTIEIRKESTEGELIAKIPLSDNTKGVLAYDLKKEEGEHNLYFVFKNKHAEPTKGVCSINWMVFTEPLAGSGEAGFEKIQQTYLDLLNTEGNPTPIMFENKPDFHRNTYVFSRGNWLVRDKQVEPDVPATLGGLPADAPKNRLGLAHWIVSEENPLTARVTVNRFWEQLFGKGLVETLEDFGSQGETPSHPELLDWLAWQFMHENDWSMKALLKQMVMSATYRQSSEVSLALLETDPANRLLARGPRFRLNAEQIRDQVLAVSGLLSDKMYGESVMPLQPNGVWQVVYSGESWNTSQGEDQYRRAVYTYWRRTSPYPSMVSFDAPSREFCTTRRVSTNTPLQALVTLNDPVYFEAAQQLASNMLTTSDNLDEQLKAGYKRVLFREISDNKLEELKILYNEVKQYYRDNPEAIQEVLSDPASFFENTDEKEDENGGMEQKIDREEQKVRQKEKIPCDQDDCYQLAALTVAANTLLNLDEFITKE